jgi:MFS family permease
LAYVTSAVQLGFICGTLLFAILVIADRFSPRRVFFCCSLAGALANIALLVAPPGLETLLLLRFATGFFLAGIYPVGMKIAAGWYQQGLGRALGYLVGALVVGTAFPHLIRSSGAELPWQQVIAGVSILALGGGFAMLRASSVERLRFQPASAGPGVWLAPVSRLGLRLLRSHVGAVHLVGLYSGPAAGLLDPP